MLAAVGRMSDGSSAGGIDHEVEHFEWEDDAFNYQRVTRGQGLLRCDVQHLLLGVLPKFGL